MPPPPGPLPQRGRGLSPPSGGQPTGPPGEGPADPGWRRSQLGITLVVFIAFFGFNFVMPVLPLYVRSLGIADVSQAALLSGVMLGISPLLAAFCSPL